MADVLIRDTDVLAAKLGLLTIVVGGATIIVMLFSAVTNTFLSMMPIYTILGGLAGGLGLSTKVALGNDSPFAFDFNLSKLVTINPVQVSVRKPRIKKAIVCPQCHSVMKPFVTTNEFGVEKTVFACESPAHEKTIQVKL